jgi:ATP-dependent DNA helicase DinG
MNDVLGPAGSLAAAIPHYEDRPEQRAMSAAVSRALADNRPLLVEAGTGTGKTLAYLVPALASGKRVVVSTGTRTLQDQIARHDLPILRTILGRPFTAVVLKGVANYVCRRRLEEARRARVMAGGEHLPDIADLVDWADESATGDRAEVDWLPEAAPVWSEITTTPDARLGHRCPYFERCFTTQARRAAERADLILVNHHLYFSDLSLRTQHRGARILPEHQAVIFDEAHQLEDVATEHFGARVSTLRFGELVRDARQALGRIDLFDGRGAGEAHVLALDKASTQLFSIVRQVLLAASSGADGRVPAPPDLLSRGLAQDAWFRTDGALEELARFAEAEADVGPDAEPDEKREDFVHVARRARDLRDDLATLAEQRSQKYVYWGEVRPTGTFLHASPISVSDLLRRHLVHGEPTAVFTSATLSVAGAFGFTRQRLGLPADEVDELTVPSPFDYARQALLYLPRDLPVPADDGFSAATAARIAELLEITAGRAFCLFTSHKALREAARRLAGSRWPLLVQGQEPRATLIDRFRATAGAVLLGTGSFWEGVDVPGDALSMVVIDKLPFAPHTDPLIAARAQQVTERGGDPFSVLQLPQAAIALKQGFGRLIRRRDDRGIVAVLDPRIVTKGYGRVFLATLPGDVPRTSSLEQVRRWWAAPGAAAG